MVKSSRLERTPLRICQAAETKLQRADSEIFSASAIRLPRLPAVSTGRSNVTGTSQGL
jgi:hypothetical protein